MKESKKLIMRYHIKINSNILTKNLSSSLLAVLNKIETSLQKFS